MAHFKEYNKFMIETARVEYQTAIAKKEKETAKATLENLKLKLFYLENPMIRD